MKKLLLSAGMFAMITCAYAQKNDHPEKYAKYISAEDARKHLSILASDEYEGRETGKPGADKAAHYVANEFKKLGLQAPVNGSYFFNVPLVDNSLKANFSVDGQAFANGYDFLVSGLYADKTITASDVLFIGYGTEGEIANTDITGKILLWINEDKPQAGTTTNTSYRLTPARTKILNNLRSKNPALILAVNPGIADILNRFRSSILGSRLSIKKEDTKPLSQQAALFAMTTEAANKILKASGKTVDDFKKLAETSTSAVQSIKADIKINYYTETKEVKAVDVLGLLPGTDLKDEILVFSAHYDHIGLNLTGTDKVNNGADDDGSGTTGILEIARAFTQAKKAGHGPRRSILFLGNVGEEKGLLGSEYYTDHPVFPLTNTITDINIDMIGRVGYEYIGKPDSANYVYTIGSAMLSKELHQINEDANNKYTHLNQDYKYDDPNDPNQFYYRSDHYNFAKHGVPIIFFFNGEHADYHQPGDEVSKINFPLLAKRAQLAFYTGWELANRDKRPVVDKPTK